VAKAFKDDINKTHDQQTAAALATLQDELDTALARKGKDDQAVVVALRERISQLQADRNNVLQELQSRGGVSVQPPSLFNNVVLALAGGLLLGVLVALALARFSPRLRSRHDVADKVGLNTLVELPGPGTKGAQLVREQRLRQLATILRASLAGPGVVAVTQATDGAATGVVARGLAMEWASQGYGTVLIRFGAGMESLPPRIGETTAVGPVEASAALSRMRAGPVPGMSILDMRPRLAGGDPRLPAMMTELFELEQLVGAFIIIETPAVLDSADAQAASLAADATILVIDTQVAKVPETREAVGVLRQPGVVLLGAVLAPVRDEEDNPDESHLDEASNPDESHLDDGSDPDESHLDEASNPDESHLDDGSNPDESHLDERNGHQPQPSRPDAWLLAPWASPTGSAEWSSSPTPVGLTDSSEPRRRLPDDVTKPAQDAARNGASSRRVQTGKI
jgi:Mrp family chromosome partitioning ATPase